jgi:hypothetical protein
MVKDGAVIEAKPDPLSQNIKRTATRETNIRPRVPLPKF